MRASLETWGLRVTQCTVAMVGLLELRRALRQGQQRLLRMHAACAFQGAFRTLAAGMVAAL